MDVMLLSLLIPTMNRPKFLGRLLRYYSDLGFRHNIYIGDSSSSPHIEQVRNVIKIHERKLNIFYYEYPGVNNAVAVSNLLASVSSPYAVLLPDDDLVIPNSVEQCVRFLENHKEYSAAHGLAVIFSLESSGAFGPFVQIGKYWQRPVEGETGVGRLLDHLSNYSVTLFSVHRTETMRSMYKNIGTIGDKAFAMELLPCCLSVIQGKVKELDCFYLARQDHARRYLLADVYDWVTSPDWLSSYLIFRDQLAEALAQRDAISINEAKEVVKRAFWSYLARGLTHKWRVRYEKEGARARPYWREIARRVPGLPNMWHKFRSATSGRGSEMSLPALLHPSSPYHADFMPIYRAVSEAR